MAFCVNCGARLPEGSRFCGNCGAQMGQSMSGVKMQKNGVVFTKADEIDFEIYGDDMQLVEIELDPGESVIAEAGAMNYMDACIGMETIFGDGSGADEGKGFGSKLLNAGKRALTGEGLFMTVFTNNDRTKKAKVAFASSYPGKIIPVDLDSFDRTLICQKSAFLCAAKGVNIDLHFQKKLGAGFFGGEGFIMQRLTGDGVVFLNAGGTIVKKTLAPGEMLKLDTGCLVAMSETINYDVAFQNDIKSGLFGGEGLFLATLTGPGEVWMQSLPFGRMAREIASVVDLKGSREESGGFSINLGEGKGGLGSLFNL